MRPLEALLVGAVVVVLAMRWMQPRNRQVSTTLLAMVGILASLHLFFDGARWEMIPAYAMALAIASILSRDLRRVSGAKAGESSRWVAVPSAAQRAGRGMALLLAAAIAVIIPAWAFPRIVLPEPDGLYDVGRLDVTVMDSARGNRPIDVAIWYPAESPNGKPLPYHPDPGTLGRALAQGTPLPGFTFRNLAGARTHSTPGPRFSIREGRSPLVIVAHDSAAHRYEGTAVWERLANHGYVVASLGMSGTTPADGAADLRAVLDRLVSLPAGGAVDTLNTHIRVDRIALVGRGTGAAAALELGAIEPRVTAVAAIAPTTLGDAAQRGVRRPLLVFTVDDPTDRLTDAMRYGGTEVRLDGASEAALSDQALVGAPILDLLGIASGDAPRDIHAAVSALTLRFLDQYLKERRAETEVDLPSRVRVRVIPHQPRVG